MPFGVCAQVIIKPGGEANPEDSPPASAVGTTAATPTLVPSDKRAAATAFPTVAPCMCDVAKVGSQDDGGGSGVDTLTVVVIVIAVLQQLAIGVAVVLYCQNRKSGAADEVRERARAQAHATTANTSFGASDTYDAVAASQTFAPQTGLEITTYADGTNTAA